MKIVHIAPKSPYDVGWGFHENLLPKYQVKAGHEVTLIVTNLVHKDGKIVETNCLDTIYDNGVKVIRLKRKEYKNPVITAMNSKLEVYELLCEEKPDFIFYHGLLGTTIYDAVKYKKKINPQCVIVQDNHVDENNANVPCGIKGKLIRAFSRHVVRKTIPYISRVYGVTPWRKTYAEAYYKVPKSKTDVLVMGADDEKLDLSRREKVRREIRERYGVSQEDFLIVTGGKINRAKNIHLLADAVKGSQGVKLLVFGEAVESFKAEYEALAAGSENIINIGWIESHKVYDYFFAGDLGFFPGGHSVMWEQACASGLPCVFKKWDEMEHLDIGGNCRFIDDISTVGIACEIEKLKFTDAYFKMKAAAESPATNAFMYSKISEKSLECSRK